MYTLAEHGDPEERVAWPLFLAEEFPQYEEFWRLFVVALTGRALDEPVVGFLPQAVLDSAGRPAWHVEVAQLHYTTLLHLVRVAQVRRRRVRDRDSFLEAMVRLDAATDTACELLGRCLLDRGKSASWNETAGSKVRADWHRGEGSPLKPLHDYRNALLHGRVRPEFELRITTEIGQTRVPSYPTFDAMLTALDWRDAAIEQSAPADQLVDEAWELVLGYFRVAWHSKLLPWAHENFVAPETRDAPRADVPPQIGFRGDAARSASADAPGKPTGGSVSFSETRIDPPLG